MTKSAYRENPRYNALFISAKMIDVVNQAYEAGLIDKKTGTESSGQTTRIRASAKLAAIFNETDLTLFDLTEEQPNQEVIILSKHDFINDKKKRIQVDYEDTDFEPIESMRQQLQEYNTFVMANLYRYSNERRASFRTTLLGQESW
jgi:hypothetical protein